MLKVKKFALQWPSRGCQIREIFYSLPEEWSNTDPFPLKEQLERNEKLFFQQIFIN